MKILITGGAGFVGSNLSLYLKKNLEGSDISCIDNLKRRGSELSLPALKKSGINFIHGDIRNPEDIDHINEADFIIDASAEPSVLAGIGSAVYPVINTNLNGTIHLLEKAKRISSNFIFLSTSRVYPIQALNSICFTEEATRYKISKDQTQSGITTFGISEDFSLQGSRSFYGSTKLASELFIEEYQAYGGVRSIINRCGVIAGPGQMGKIDQGVMTLWIAKHYWKGDLNYIGFEGSGKQVRDILHIDDFCRLILYQIRNFESLHGNRFNIGGGTERSVSLLELTSLCEEVTGNRIKINKVGEGRQADVRVYETDNRRVTGLTKWAPTLSPKETVQDIFTWIRSNELQLKPILS